MAVTFPADSTSVPVRNRARPLETDGSLEADKRRLYKAAKNMEALFLNQLLKAMRNTIPESEDDSGPGLGGGLGKGLYTEMFDQELAQNMSGLTPNSLADILYGSLERVLESCHQTPTEKAPGDIEISPGRQHLNIRSSRGEGVKTSRNRGSGAADSLAAYDNVIQGVSKKYRLDPELIRAVIRVESNGDPAAVSRAGAKGLMQLVDTTASDMGVKDVFNPEENINGGSRYLRRLIDDFGDLRLALAAYNAGPGTVKRYGGIPPYPETIDYIQSVLARMAPESSGRN